MSQALSDITQGKGGLIMAFNTGDLVRHKTGSPKLVVAGKVDPEGGTLLYCTWWDDSRKDIICFVCEPGELEPLDEGESRKS
jgi:uncharacterized protein YodC (DUF2158 family)